MNKKRILVGCINLESNSSTPYRATEKDFAIKRGGDMLKDSPAMDYLVSRGYDVIPSFYAWSGPSGVLKLETYMNFVTELLACVPLDGSIDGIWLDCHGAMQVEFIGSGESFLVSQIRERVGPKVPIALSLDFHASISHTLCRLTNMIVGFRTAPHTDITETRMKAVKMLDRAVSEGVLPWTKIIKVPLLLPGEFCTTESYPASYITEQLDKMQELTSVWNASFFTGMSWCDCSHNGNSIVVSGVGDWEGDVSGAMVKLADEIWNARHDFKMTTGTMMEPEKAVAEALSADVSPVFISDSGDNTTAGAIGDNAYMLGELIGRHAADTLVAGIYDEFAVAECEKAGEGGVVDLSLGGAYDEKSKKLMLKGVKVLHLQKDEHGRVLSVLINADGVDAIITPVRTDFTCAESFERAGTVYTKYKVIVVKLGYLFPGLAAIAAKSIIALTAGNSMLDVRGLCHDNKRRPIFPVEDNFGFKADKQMIF